LNSKTLRKFLEKYFKDESVKPENEQQIKVASMFMTSASHLLFLTAYTYIFVQTMAAEALNRLDKIVAYGQRKEVILKIAMSAVGTELSNFDTHAGPFRCGA